MPTWSSRWTRRNCASSLRWLEGRREVRTPVALPSNAASGALKFARWRAARKVLAVRLGSFGGVLMSTPACKAIKRAAPGMDLTLLAAPATAAEARHLPHVDRAIAYGAPWAQGADGGTGLDLAVVETLREGCFDAAIIFSVATQSALPAALLCRMAGIPLRLAHSRENPHGLLTNWIAETDACLPGMRHEVRRQLDLVAAVGFEAGDEGLKFRCGAEDAAGMRLKFAAAGGDPGESFFVVHPGAQAASRRYPAARFGAAAGALARMSGCRAVFCAGPGEEGLADEARLAAGGQGRMLSLAGQLSLGELAALIDAAELLVCNHGAPAQLAAALGTPLVELYPLTHPQHTPWRAVARVLNRDVPCRNCLSSVCPQGHHECLMGVAVEEVVEAGLGLMASRCADPHPRPLALMQARE